MCIPRDNTTYRVKHVHTRKNLSFNTALTEKNVIYIKNLYIKHIVHVVYKIVLNIKLN